MIPKWLTPFISEAQLKEVEAEVHRQEKQTAGEIVTVIVRRSTPLGFMGWWIGLSFCLMYFILEVPVASDWGISAWQHYLVLAVFLGLGQFLARFKAFQRAFLPLNDQILSVVRRAELELYHSKAVKTKQRTAILIFVSLMERRAVILGDIGIAEKLPPETWDSIVGQLVQKSKQGDLAGGLVTAVKQSGELLAQHFPVQSGDQNELLDSVIIKP